MNYTQPCEQHPGGQAPPTMRGGFPYLGHILPFALHPYAFAKKTADTLGEVAAFKLLGQQIVMLTGDEASEVFYRSNDETLDQSAAYKLMTPIFGEGLVFDAPLKKKDEQLKMIMPSLRMDAMRSHSAKIVQEVEGMISNWDDEGEIDLVECMKNLTINTASHCLLGKEFRYELTDEFSDIYRDLEKGVNPLAYHFPNLPLPSFIKRDKARARLQALVEHIVKKRQLEPHKPDDMFQSFIDAEYKDGSKLDANEITGLLTGAIFAGHHTSSGTAAWVLIELLKHPHLMRSVKNELDLLLGADGEVSFQSLREMPHLENVVKEVLRLHPPLIILMRQVSKDLYYKNYTIKKGDMVWAVPPVTHRSSKLFSNPEAFDPDRFSAERQEDKNLMAYQPFGGGKHKCSGNAFAMFQIKAIFAVLLRRYEFDLIDPASSYQDNYKEMIVQPLTPCRIRYKKRDPGSFSSKKGLSESLNAKTCPNHNVTEKNKISILTLDESLYQGHGVCIAEADKYFENNANGQISIKQKRLAQGDKDQLEKAIKYCPTQALSIQEHE